MSICKKQIFNWVTVETTDIRNYEKNSVVAGKKIPQTASEKTGEESETN